VTSVFRFLRAHKWLWLLPLILVPLILALIFVLARAESAIGDSPFIYDL